MAVADRYSQMVLWLKVALPLLALAILSTLFFVAETLEPDAAIPYAKVDVEKILREQGITKPAFGTVTANGIAVSVSAEAVRPVIDQREQMSATELKAKLSWPDGALVDITSPEGLVNASAGEISLGGGVRLESSAGYVIETDSVMASIKEATVTTDDSVRATGPVGEITAGRMELTRQTNADGDYLIVFKDGVRLLYQPRP